MLLATGSLARRHSNPPPNDFIAMSGYNEITGGVLALVAVPTYHYYSRSNIRGYTTRRNKPAVYKITTEGG